MRASTLPWQAVLLSGLAAAQNNNNNNNNGASSCEVMNKYNCNNLRAYSQLELNDPLVVELPDLDPRTVNFIELDSESLNVTELTRRGEAAELDGEALHEYLERKISESEEDNDPLGVLMEYQRLTKRGGSEEYPFCKSEAEMKYKTPSYPEGSVNYDSADWGNCRNFDLAVGKPNQANQPYIAEHVLERQMLQQFSLAHFEGKQLPSGQGVCQYLSAYWTGAGMNPPGGSVTVQGLPAWHFVSSAWPKKDADGNKEMLRTQQEINLAKAFAFKGGVSLNEDNKFRGWLKKPNEMPNAIHAIKVIILFAKYFNHDDTQKIYKDQGDRVAANFKIAEDELEALWANDPAPYQRLNLDQLWLQWIKEYTDHVHGKTEDHMNLWAGRLRNAITEVERNTQKMNSLSPAEKDALEDLRQVVRAADNLPSNGRIFRNPW